LIRYLLGWSLWAAEFLTWLVGFWDAVVLLVYVLSHM
jgi:hypothetical protein